MRFKVAELSGRRLDWVVTDLEFERRGAAGEPVKKWVHEHHRDGALSCHYSTDWLWAGPIIDRERMSVCPVFVHGDWYGDWRAIIFGFADQGERTEIHADTPLVAAMRCYVASQRGEEVEVPDAIA